MLSFGPQGFILTGNGYSFMATIEDIDVGIEEMLFMREDSGEGITIYEDEEY